MLVALAVKADESGEVFLPSMDGILDLVEMSRESVCRCLKNLSAAGIIERRGKAIRLSLECDQWSQESDQRSQNENVTSGHRKCDQRSQKCDQRSPLLNKQKPSLLLSEEKLTVNAREGGAADRLLKAERDYCRRGPRPINDSSIERGIADLTSQYSETQIVLAVNEVVERAEAAFKRGRPWASLQVRYVLDQLQARKKQASSLPDEDVSRRQAQERMRKVLEEIESGVKWEAHR